MQGTITSRRGYFCVCVCVYMPARLLGVSVTQDLRQVVWMLWIQKAADESLGNEMCMMRQV